MRAFRLLALIALAVTTVTAGCVQPGAPGADADTDAPGAAFESPIILDHDHADLAAHAFATPTMEKLGYASLAVDGVTFSGFGEMDTHEGVAVVAAVADDGTARRGAIVLVDVTDAAAPTTLGYATIGDAGHPLDVKFDEAGEFVYATAMGQILAFDVTNPASPRPAGGMLPNGAACHMSALGVVEGVEYFFCTGDPVGLSVYRVVADAPGARSLVPVAYAPPEGGPQTGGALFGGLGAPHDLTFQADPVDETPLLVVSNRGFGVRVLDVSDPTAPVTLGSWHGEGAEYYSNHAHTAMVTVIDGTRVLIQTPEILAEGTPAAVWVLDATDYAALTLVAEWTPPGNPVSPGFTFTTHQWQVADGRLYLGFYHAGVWVLDLRAILADAYADDPARPEVLGYYLPDAPAVQDGAMVPNVWDVNLVDGVIWATDISSGLYALHYVPDPLGAGGPSGFA